MKYAILADIHANLEAFQSVLADLREQQCTHVVCLGDIVGYGANPKECVDIVRGMSIPTVKGNHDGYVGHDHNPDELVGAAAKAVSWCREQLASSDRTWLRDLSYVQVVAGFSIVHATLDHPQLWRYAFEKFEAAASLAYQDTQVCFFGHTHIPVAFVSDVGVTGGRYSELRIEPGRKYFINVGSVGQPRDGDPRAAYVIYDMPTQTVELRRLDYDIATAQRKILDR